MLHKKQFVDRSVLCDQNFFLPVATSSISFCAAPGLNRAYLQEESLLKDNFTDLQNAVC